MAFPGAAKGLGPGKCRRMLIPGDFYGAQPVNIKEQAADLTCISNLQNPLLQRDFAASNQNIQLNHKLQRSLLMTSRLVLDASSSGQSSTAANIRRYIRETELSDGMGNRSVPSTAQTSHHEAAEGLSNAEKDVSRASHGFSVEFSESPEVSKNGPLRPITEEFETPSLDIPIFNTNNDNSYKNRLKFLPNADFQFENHSFPCSTDSPPVSIPNTFRYKSHANAKTKAHIGQPDAEEAAVPPEDILKSIEREIDDNPMKTSTIKDDPQDSIKKQSSTAEFNSTPEWMPSELSARWVPPPETNNALEGLESPEFSSSVRITQQPDSKPFELNFNLSSTNTMIHNSKGNSNGTPMWKKVAKEYEMHKQSQPQLRNIFLSSESLKAVDKSDTKFEGHNSISSSFSTPVMSMEKGASDKYFQLTKDQIENVLEENKDKPNNYELTVPNPESPLKLFGHKYNTFTKGKLNALLAKMNNKQSPEAATELEKIDTEPIDMPTLPKLNIKNFTRSGSYTEEQFLQNANDIFNNIQKRGFKGGNGLTKPSNETLTRNRSHTTATSTPKVDRINDQIEDLSSQDDYSSFTSGFDENEEEERANHNSDLEQPETHNNLHVNDDYTSFDRTSSVSHKFERDSKHARDGPHRNSTRNESSYTFDDLSEGTNLNAVAQEVRPLREVEEYSFENKSSGSDFNQVQHPRYDSLRFRPQNMPTPENEYAASAHQQDLASRINDLEAFIKSLNIDAYQENFHQLQLENKRLREELLQQRTWAPQESMDDFTDADASHVSDFIKWKRASQLRLRAHSTSSTVMKDKSSAANKPVTKGRVKPGVNFPESYNNMILDVENQKWIANDKENQLHGSLDSIEDLLTNSAENDGDSYRSPDNSILKSARSPKKNESKLEVSFHLPPSNGSKNFADDRSPASSEGVTQVSQLDEITFSQTRKNLVSVITNVLSMSDERQSSNWSQIESISFANQGLENVKDLYKFLPRLSNVDISHNEIKFLEGLSTQILQLDASHNSIDSMSSFMKFRDLLILNVSFNNLINLASLSSNIHLTKLKVNNNMLKSLDGIKHLSNLISLDLSQNCIAGDIDFKDSSLVNLQDLNVSENDIKLVSGLDSLVNLRVFNANENQIRHVSCSQRHKHLKKLLIKANRLRNLDLSRFPYLRVLRMDGNYMKDVPDLKELKYLQEISCKTQENPGVVEKVLQVAMDLQTMDISGNSLFKLECLSNDLKFQPFLNINTLVLSAMGLESLPSNFAHMFPNVRELNLNFNILTDILALTQAKNLKRVFLLSNSISSVEMVLTSMNGSRKTLRVLDLRINPINLDHYPYVFNPQELEISQLAKRQSPTALSPIPLETLDDIESFAIHYTSLSKNHDEWMERDSKFIEKLSTEGNPTLIRERLNYETLLSNFFHQLKELDGSFITAQKRKNFKEWFRLEGVQIEESF